MSSLTFDPYAQMAFDPNAELPTPPKPMWDAAEGIAFCRKLEGTFGRTCLRYTVHEDNVGKAEPRDVFHFSLGGGVLYRGHSDKDLDIVVRRGKLWYVGAEKELKAYLAGLGYLEHNSFQGKGYAEKGATSAHVNQEIIVFHNNEGRRIDLFIQHNRAPAPPPMPAYGDGMSKAEMMKALLEMGVPVQPTLVPHLPPPWPAPTPKYTWGSTPPMGLSR